MKQIIAYALCLSLMQEATAQLYISPGAQFFARGRTQLTLHNTDFINDGNFFPGSGTMLFTGSNNNQFGGLNSTAIHTIEIQKSTGARLTMQQIINVTDTVLLTTGNIELNGQVLDLGSTARLVGEKETSRVTGSNGGYIVVAATLNNPVNANPGNLGAVITSNKDLGNVLVRRGHRSQQNNYGLGNSILRYYDILPANNTELGATLQIHYFDGELNGLNENSLEFWSSNDYLHWKNEYYSLGNINLNYFEKQGVDHFPIRWTLSNANNPLEVIFRSFSLQCTGDGVMLNWQTAQEQSSDHFRIERSPNSTDWEVIGRMVAAGNSSNIKSYSFTDKGSLGNSYYRVVEVDKDGSTTFTNLLRSACHQAGSVRVWPNPFTDKIYTSLYQEKSVTVVLLLRDDAGRLLKKQIQQIPGGNSLLQMQTADLPKGVYWLEVYRNDEKYKETFQLIRQ